MQRYLPLWLAITLALLLGVGAFNLAVDPYGVFRLVDQPGFNAIKPKSGSHGAMTKAYQVLRVYPRGLILGNSRAEVGFDPEHQAWPARARPVFNLALPGTGTSTTLHYFQHVLANSNRTGGAKPEIVIWGIDFMDFLVDAGSATQARKGGREGGRLLVNTDGSLNPTRLFRQLKDYGESSLTLAAFLDSVETLGSQRSPFAEDLTSLGFNPMRDYQKIASDEGYWALFRQRDIENIKAYRSRPQDIFDAQGRSSPALDDLRQVLRLCKQHGITMHLVIYPYHAHLLQIFRMTGHWPAFENWKRAITHIVDTESGSPDVSRVTLWDFSGFNEVTMEPVPGKGDRRTKMRWYWEAGHFKHELGTVIQERIFAGNEPIPGLGVRLTAASIEKQISALQAQEALYRKSHPQAVEALERVFSATQSRK